MHRPRLATKGPPRDRKAGPSPCPQGAGKGKKRARCPFAADGFTVGRGAGSNVNPCRGGTLRRWGAPDARRGKGEKSLGFGSGGRERGPAQTHPADFMARGENNGGPGTINPYPPTNVAACAWRSKSSGAIRLGDPARGPKPTQFRGASRCRLFKAAGNVDGKAAAFPGAGRALGGTRAPRGPSRGALTAGQRFT